MQYFKIDGTINAPELVREDVDRRSWRNMVSGISCATSEYNRKHGDEGSIAVSAIRGNHIQMCAFGISDDFLGKHLDRFVSHLKISISDISVEEVIYETVDGLLRNAYREDFIEDDSEFRGHAGLGEMDRRWGRGCGWDENLIRPLSRDEAVSACGAFLGSGCFIEELDRIYGGKDNVRMAGHPVHYLIQTSNHTSRRKMHQTLVGALYSKGRLRNLRYTYVDLRGSGDFDRRGYEALYRMAEGGCMIVRYLPTDEEESGYASAERDNVEFISSVMRKYRHKVLTVLCLPLECAKTKSMFYENLENMCLIELKEGFASGDEARSYLKYLAGGDRVRSDKLLSEAVEEGKEYSSNDLRNIYECWYDAKLKRSCYPQYRQSATVKKKVHEEVPKGTAYDRLGEMIGLDAAKEVIGQALDYYKALRIFRDRGICQDHPAMHMCFTGSPGTAKTTVARLFAEIMKDNGLLERGQLIECGRQDLVGRFVGWTAPTVQKKFREAKGGVLFIDEAYSLVDDRDGSFGDEAISAIVAEMENHREDVVVIFAGYPDKMEGFLRKNPGLRSRIAFHVPFDDYGTEELIRIAELIARDKGMKLSRDAETKLSGIFEEARKQGDFGNGRYARNIIEKARMSQCSRLVRMDLDEVSGDDLVTITAEDIEAPKKGYEETARRIGFCA